MEITKQFYYVIMSMYSSFSYVVRIFQIDMEIDM